MWYEKSKNEPGAMCCPTVGAEMVPGACAKTRERYENNNKIDVIVNNISAV